MAFDVNVLPQDDVKAMLKHVDDVLVQIQTRLAQLEAPIDTFSRIAAHIETNGIMINLGAPK